MEEEIWVELIDEGAKGKYISNFGNVMCDYGLKFSKNMNSDGYYTVCITSEMYKSRTHSLHRLIGKYFVEGYSEERCDINHKDGNKSNNYYKNLEWVTHQENMIHSRENEFKLTYDGKGGSQLNEEAVIKIKIMLAKGYPHHEIAKQFGVTRPCITQIASGNRWAEIIVDTSNIEFKRNKKYKTEIPKDCIFKRGDIVKYRSKTGRVENIGEFIYVGKEGCGVKINGEIKNYDMKFLTLIERASENK